MELNRFKQLLESQLGNVKPLLYEQDEEVIVTNHDNDYDYKKVGDKFYFKLKENPKSSRAKSFKTQGKYIDWTESAGAGLESIKKSVYKINTAGSGGSSTEPPKPKGAATTNAPKEPEKESGCVSGDCENGKGKYVHTNGYYYEGDWKDGKMNGKGKYVYDDGYYYEGDWKDDNQNGKGKYVYGTSGYYYEGKWKDGVWNGKGKLVYSTGDYYEGDWKDGEKNGYGQEYQKNGKLIFSGLYKNNSRFKGTLTYDDNSYYRGNLKDDSPNGMGVKYGVDDKIIFAGEWVNGEPKEK